MRGGRSICVEQIESAGDIREENEDLRSFYGSRLQDSTTSRLSFFSTEVTSKKQINRIPDSSFIGYAVIKRDVAPGLGPQTRVYESVIGKSGHPNNYIRDCPSWRSIGAGRPFDVTGYLYAQQNDATNVCAHVALRTALSRFQSDGEWSYRQMNRLIGVDHVKRKVGGPKGTGLGSDEIETVLNHAGAWCLVANYALKNPHAEPVPFQKCIYGSIESGYPALVAFQTTGPARDHHVIPIFGHTFNEDIWVPDADFSYFRIGSEIRYIPSETWLSMFVGHDDNWGSNICIPRHYLQGVGRTNRKNGVKQAYRRVDLVVGTYPKGVKVNSIAAEAIARDYLSPFLEYFTRKKTDWGTRLKEALSTGRLVLRPILLEFDEYLKHLELVKDWDGNRIDSDTCSIIRQNIRDTMVWMIEVSVPNLFPANRRKVGEIVVSAQKPLSSERDFRSFVLARILGDFVVGGGFRAYPSGLTSHVEVYGCEEDNLRSIPNPA